MSARCLTGRHSRFCGGVSKRAILASLMEAPWLALSPIAHRGSRRHVLSTRAIAHSSNSPTRPADMRDWPTGCQLPDPFPAAQGSPMKSLLRVHISPRATPAWRTESPRHQQSSAEGVIPNRNNRCFKSDIVESADHVPSVSTMPAYFGRTFTTTS
jgi:hypothetical protein